MATTYFPFFEAVSRAAEDLTANGVPVTSRSVRGMVKRGSYTRILSALKLWNIQHAAKNRVLDFPIQFPNELVVGTFRVIGTNRGRIKHYVGFPYLVEAGLREVELVRLFNRAGKDMLENADIEGVECLRVFTEVVLQSLEDALLCREKSKSTRTIYNQSALEFLKALKTDSRLRLFYVRHSIFSDTVLERLHEMVSRFSTGKVYDDLVEIHKIGLHNTRFLTENGFMDDANVAELSWREKAKKNFSVGD